MQPCESHSVTRSCSSCPIKKWHAHHTLIDLGGVRYSARLLELKRLGYRITTREIGRAGGGKEYRLLSTKVATPKPKQVKIYMNEYDAALLVSSGVLSEPGRAAVNDALRSFRANRDKL